MKLLRKNKNCGDGIGNFRPLTMLNAEFVLSSVISSEQTCSVMGRDYSGQPSFCSPDHLKNQRRSRLIDLKQSKAFDR